MDFPEIVVHDRPPVRGRRKPQRKRPTVEGLLAALLSLVVPGLGQFCQGRVVPGMAFLLAAVVGAALISAIVGIPIFLVAWIWSVVDAAQA
jgi:TM2 domain-containing membrane protein YozV